MATVVFDLDGTLADTSRDLIAAANTVLHAYGWAALLDPERDQATAFRGGRAMLRLGLARAGGARGEAELETQVEAGYPRLLDAYGQALAVHTTLYPGAERATRALRTAGYATAICTNKMEHHAEALLRHLGIRDLFDGLVGADTLPLRKPDPAPLREAARRAGGTLDPAVLIGDTTTDREIARAAGIPCILVTFGPDGRTVGDLAPEGLLDDYADLPDLVARLIGRPG